MEMSFLGSIGHLMAGSGIKELVEMIYAPKAVEQIMSGKAISRAVRAHLLLDAVLNGLLLSKSMDIPLPCAAGVEQDDAESSDKTPCTNSDLKAAGSLYDELVAMAKDAEEVANSVFVADNTELVILLCYYTDPDGFDLFMEFSTRRTTKKNRIWDIKVTQSELGANICNNILFIHAILGCDTTSRLYGLGKELLLKRFTSSALFRDKAEQFCKKDATVDDVIDAGEAALVCLYSVSV